MARFGSRQKRSARKAKVWRRQCESNVSNTGGLFLLDTNFKRDSEKPIDDESLQKIALLARTALDRILYAPDANVDDYATVAAAINTGYVLTEMGIGAENRELFIAGQEAITKLYERGTRTGIWRFDGASAETVRNATEIYEVQSENVYLDEIRKAYQTVIDRVKNGNIYQIERVTA